MTEQLVSVPSHVEQSAIVMDEFEILYVPVPKAGSTGMLWALHGLVGLEGDDFTGSSKLETTRTLTIHDMSVWGKANRLVGRVGRTRQLFESDRWLTFTVVRDPLRRLWSAWVSKILMHDPRFVRAYGHEDWFPRTPRSWDEILASFRAFVAVLSERPRDWHDPHWSSQVELVGIGPLSYDVVGKVEDLSSVFDTLNRHLHARGRQGISRRSANASLVRFVPEALDRATWERCAAFTALDREVLGYALEPYAEGEPADDWVAEVEARLPAVRAVVERNQRIGDLTKLVTRSRAS